MTNFYRVFAIASAFVLFGCYHATVVTGLKPSTETIEESFAASWVYGLVPPSTVATEAKCPNGVAKVETQLSFVNQLVGALTFGIYTPMEIKVTCAEKSTSSLLYQGPDITLHSGATDQEFIDALVKAADIAVKEHRAAYVEY
ncbi:MAG: Bor family protein [Ignavibacteriae bacterium]|nr:Bor family protein [Ignavibacteria bacterium]MBI3365213.1 Bor family protein [Ignavibacteriota bacterium]